MTYIVNDSCIRCKLMDCVEVCPVDCFYEGENMLVIHPDECIDCGICEPECPIEAIRPDTEPGLEKFLKLNADFAKIWRTCSSFIPPSASTVGSASRNARSRRSGRILSLALRSSSSSTQILRRSGEHARHSSRRVHRLWALRAGMPDRGDQAGY